MLSVLNSIGSYERLRELAEADKEGRVVVLPCKVGDVLYAAETDPIIPLHVMAVAIYLEVEGEAYGDYERKIGEVMKKIIEMFGVPEGEL
jgi:hypothetical protein